MGIILLRAVADDRITICEFLAFFQHVLYFVMCHDKHCICSFLACFIVTLCHAAKNPYQMQSAMSRLLPDCASTFNNLILFCQLPDVPSGTRNVQSAVAHVSRWMGGTH
jgi:hypothetical protein